MLRFVSAFALAVLGLTGASSASAAPSYWTAAQAQNALKQPTTLILSVYAWGNRTMVKSGLVARNGTSFPDRGDVVQAATCRGFGTRYRTGFAAFRCDAQYSLRVDIRHTVYRASFWVRPLPWRASPRWGPAQSLICASARTLADCPPPIPARPLTGDPRACGVDCSPERSLGNLADPATDAVLKQLRADGLLPVANLGCHASSAFVYRCTWNLGQPGATATVRFVQGKTHWTTAITRG
jgi:hypothetical protein